MTGGSEVGREMEQGWEFALVGLEHGSPRATEPLTQPSQYLMVTYHLRLLHWLMTTQSTVCCYNSNQHIQCLAGSKLSKNPFTWRSQIICVEPEEGKRMIHTLMKDEMSNTQTVFIESNAKKKKAIGFVLLASRPFRDHTVCHASLTNYSMLLLSLFWRSQ